MVEHLPKRNGANTLGSLSLLIWSIGTVIIAHTRQIPLFEMLSIVFFASFLVSATLMSLSNEWRFIKQPIHVWLIGLAGICLTDILYAAAFRFAPPEQVVLVNYTWPILVVLFSGCLPGQVLRHRYLLASVIGFFGLYILSHADHMSYRSFWGYFLAFLGGVIWSFYVIARSYRASDYADIPVGLYFGIGFLLCLPIHLLTESFQMPSMMDGFLLIFLGVVSHLLAYLFWHYGLKWGDFRLLSVLAYAKPMMSVLLLILCGMAHFTLSLGVGGVLIVLACVLANANDLGLRLVCKKNDFL